MIGTNPRRPGTTMIELILVISLMSIFMIALAGLFLFAWRGDKASRTHRTAASAFMRLENQIREDIHTARSVELTDASSGVSKLFVVLPSGRKIEYAAEQGAVMRLVLDGDRTIQRESYTIPFESEPQWRVETHDNGTQVSFHLGERKNEDRENMRAGQALFSFGHVDAVLGLSPEIVEVRKASP